MFAGFVVTNSETGCGAGHRHPADHRPGLRQRDVDHPVRDPAVHLGERMDEGIQWSSDTLDRQLELVTAKARDAVTAFLDPGDVARLVREMEQHAGHRVADAPRAIEVIGPGCGTPRRSRRRSSITSSPASADGGRMMHAVTSAAQVEDDGDASWDLETSALDALRVAASL